jgi:hypothetical protein
LKARRTLRSHLTIAYAIALAVGLCAFAVFSLTAIDNVLKATLDARMAITLRALSATIGARHVDVLPARETQELLQILGVQQNGAIVRAGGAIAMESASPPPAVLAAAEAGTGGLTYQTVGSGTAQLRVAKMPFMSGGKRIATLIVWRPIDFVTDYEHGAAFVFAVTMVVVLVAASTIGREIARHSLKPSALSSLLPQRSRLAIFRSVWVIHRASPS